MRGYARSPRCGDRDLDDGRGTERAPRGLRGLGAASPCHREGRRLWVVRKSRPSEAPLHFPSALPTLRTLPLMRHQGGGGARESRKNGANQNRLVMGMRHFRLGATGAREAGRPHSSVYEDLADSGGGLLRRERQLRTGLLRATTGLSPLANGSHGDL